MIPILADFKVYLLNNDRKPLTIYKHLFWMVRILRDCPNLTIPEIDAFLAFKKEKGGKNTYINIIITTIRCYAHFIGRQDLLDHLKYRKEEVYERATMSDEEITALLKLRRPKDGWRNMWKSYTCFLNILAFTGLRPSEAIRLKVQDIDFGLGVFHIRESKTARGVGQVPISANLLPILKKYISELEGEKLFPAPKGCSTGYLKLSACSVHFQKRIKMLGIKRTNLTLYSLRHSYGTRLADQDINLFTIKNLMRHSKLTTTEGYLHMSLKTMREGQAKLPLVRKSIDPFATIESIGEYISKLNLDRDRRFRVELLKTSNGLKFNIEVT